MQLAQCPIVLPNGAVSDPEFRSTRRAGTTEADSSNAADKII